MSCCHAVLVLSNHVGLREEVAKGGYFIRVFAQYARFDRWLQREEGTSNIEVR